MSAVADPHRLRPTEAVRLLNSTPLGTVVDEWHLRQDLGSLGFRIAPSGGRVSLIRYGAWLARGRHIESAAVRRPASPCGDDGDAYERQRERASARARDSARSTRDIGEIPPIKNERRRRRARRSLRVFLETYFEEVFYFAWSQAHLDLIATTENLLINGGQRAEAMYRGGGKSTIFECGLLWAGLEGYRRYPFLLSNSRGKANESYDTLKKHLETNERLGEDYPEICFPIRALEGIAQRSSGQLYRGERTYIGLAEGVIVFPRIPGAPGSSATLRVAGLDSNIRGMGFMRPDGVKVRPDAVLIDDPQTDESARSPAQCKERERLIQSAVLGLSGHGSSFAAVMACTVIRQGDLSDRYLDHKIYPEWRGRRSKLVHAWPKATELWEEYGRLWREAQLAGDTKHLQATRHYRRNRKAMDAGAEMAWPDAYIRGLEISAVQHAWNLRLKFKEDGFAAEFQNEPLPDRPQSAAAIEVEKVLQRLNGLEHRVVPLASSKVTAFIDVQGRLLYWLVAAWEDAFSGAVIDYGSWPAQPVRNYSLANAPVTLAHAYPGLGIEAQLQRGLNDLIAALHAKSFPREDGTATRLSRCLVDCNWQTDLVCEVVRRSQFAATLTPSIGRWVGQNSKPLSEYDTKKGDRVGLNWRIPIDHGGRFVRRVLFDANWWKTFVAARLAVAPGDPGSLTIWGRDPEAHRLLAEHLAAEQHEDVEAKSSGRTITQWTLRRIGIDNHWFDALVGSAVAASIEGATLPGMPSGARKVRVRYVNYGELQARRGIA